MFFYYRYISRFEKSSKVLHEVQKILHVDKKEILLTVHEYSFSWILYLGGYNNVFCIEAQIFKDNDMNKRIYDISVGNLTHIYYNVNCSLFRDGIDTNMILRLLMSYVSTNYPYVTKLRFTDASYRECDNGIPVELSSMSYLTSGKTWYEKNFNAYIEKKEDVKNFAKGDADFQERKKDLSWDQFKDFILADFPIGEDRIKELYENTSTWQDFFGQLRDTIGVSRFCVFISSWVRAFMMQFMRFHFSGISYILPLEDNGVTYQETPYKKGGRRITRKKLKYPPRNLT